VLGVKRPAKVIAKAFNAGFQRIVQRGAATVSAYQAAHGALITSMNAYRRSPTRRCR
jgi:hypothetical protein